MMTKTDYTQAVHALGCHSMAQAGRLLGITPRQSQYYAVGMTPVPLNIEKLILAYTELRLVRSALADAWGLINRGRALSEDVTA